MGVAHGVAAHESDNDYSLVQSHIPNDGLLQCLQGQLGGHRLEPHGLMGAGFHIVQLRHVLVGQNRTVTANATDLLGGKGQALWIAPEQMDHPGQRIGGGIFPRQQHGQYIACHLRIVNAAIRLVSRSNHGLEQVGRMGMQFRLGTHARTRLTHKTVHRLHDFANARFQTPVSTRLDPAPCRYRCEDALEECGENLVQMLLYHHLIGFQRIDLGAKGQTGNGVHGKSHQVGLQRDGLSVDSGDFPPLGKA